MFKPSIKMGAARAWEPGLWIGREVERHFEDPSIRRLYANWLSRSLEGGSVRRRDLDPTELEPWLGYLIVYDYVAQRDDYVCRVQGEEAEDRLGLDLQGQSMSRFPEPLRAEVRDQYDRVRAAGAPLLAHFQMTAVREGVAVDTLLRAEKLILPLSRSDGAVDSFLSAMVAFD